MLMSLDLIPKGSNIYRKNHQQKPTPFSGYVLLSSPVPMLSLRDKEIVVVIFYDILSLQDNYLTFYNT